MKIAALSGAFAPTTRKSRRPTGGVADGVVLSSLVAIFCLTAAAAVAGAALLHRGTAPEPSHIRFVVGATALEVPSAWLRPAVSRAGGGLERLELVIPWPSDRAEPDSDPAKRAIETAAIDGVVLISLVPADSSLAPSDRPSRLYARFFNAEVWPNPGGLILRRFRAGTPYADEELYLSPPDGHAFAARCPRSSAAAPIREGCVAEIRVGGLDAQLRFSPARLIAWERLVEGARRAIAGMTVTDEHIAPNG